MAEKSTSISDKTFQAIFQKEEARRQKAKEQEKIKRKKAREQKRRYIHDTKQKIGSMVYAYYRSRQKGPEDPDKILAQVERALAPRPTKTAPQARPTAQQTPTPKGS